MSWRSRSVLAVLLMALGCADGAMARPALPPGSEAPHPYLDSARLPDARVILPPPPAAGSPALLMDEQIFLQTRAIKQQDPARWQLAANDALLDFDHLFADFAPALGLTPNHRDEPALYRLLGRAGQDLRSLSDAAKQYFGRARPYLGNHQPICVARFTSLDRTPSYPSGHAAIGWGLALILAEIAPDHATAILQRGREFGESRIVCGVHWASDVQAGTLDGAALVAALHASPEFRTDLEQAAREIAAARTRPEALANRAKPESAAP